MPTTALHSITAYTLDPECRCHDALGLVCEDHPDRPWMTPAGGDGCCGAPGQTCGCATWPCGARGPICACVARALTSGVEVE